eukprot:3870278-Pyramimonas_sp.AAC.1
MLRSAIVPCCSVPASSIFSSILPRLSSMFDVPSGPPPTRPHGTGQWGRRFNGCIGESERVGEVPQLSG